MDYPLTRGADGDDLPLQVVAIEVDAFGGQHAEMIGPLVDDIESGGGELGPAELVGCQPCPVFIARVEGNRPVIGLRAIAVDMVSAVRRTASDNACRRGHSFGNAAITFIVGAIFAQDFMEVLSGYRVFFEALHEVVSGEFNGI